MRPRITERKREAAPPDSTKKRYLKAKNVKKMVEGMKNKDYKK